MKKVITFAVLAAALTLGSCSTITHTATTEVVETEIFNRSNADLKVGEKRITYTFTPNATYRRAGEKAVRNAAIAKALEANGGGDVLVAPQFEVKKTRGLFRTNIKYVTVSGYVGKYVNVHPTTGAEAGVINAINGGVVIKKK